MQIRNLSALKYLDREGGTDHADHLSEMWNVEPYAPNKMKGGAREERDDTNYPEFCEKCTHRSSRRPLSKKKSYEFKVKT